MTKTHLTAYLLVGIDNKWKNYWLIEWKNPPDLIPKERIALVATTTEYTKEEVKKILEDCDTSVARLILEEKFAWLDYLPGNKNL